MRGWATLAFAVLLAAVVVALVVGNGDIVRVNFLVGQWDTKVCGALVAAAIFGAVAASIVLVLPVVRMKVQVRRQIRRIAELEQEIHGLRTLPIASEPAGVQSVQKV
jgi:uncharacterized membrane protein YciS (DUF1049 family)